MRSKRAFLLLTVFVAGMTTLAVELSASRLLEPYFGASNVVWANLIGLILIYLAAGYYLGGRLADRHPRESVLYQITAWAAFAVGLVPFAARPILVRITGDLATFDLAVLVGSFLGVVLLFAMPVTLLGCVSPFAVRLAVRDVASAGNVAGGIYALSTLGSIIGTFAPVLILIPSIGTRNTFLLFSLLLLITSLLGLARTWGWRALWYAPLLAIILALALLSPGGVKAAEGLIYEAESAYNYIQVVERDGTRYLLLNEGQGVQSVYDPDEIATFGAWDYFLVAPFFNQPPHPPEEVDSLCLLGLAAGTVVRQYTAVFGPIPIDGVELDPEVVAVGRELFAMSEPNLNVIVGDGRYFLAHSAKRYDVVAVDAYRLPYIPFHLTTREFFLQVRDHLSEEGVVAINVGHTEADRRLVDALASTMESVFPSVYVIEVPGTFNSLVVATLRPTRAENLRANMALMDHPVLLRTARRAWENLRPADGKGLVFTDDRAPVEQLTNSMVWRYLLEGE